MSRTVKDLPVELRTGLRGRTEKGWICERGQGPLVYALLDTDGLPMSGVICDPETGRHTRFRLPISGKAVA